MSKNKERDPQNDKGDENEQDDTTKRKNIKWILEQCMGYDKKFRNRQISPSKSLQASKKSYQSLGNESNK